MVEVTRAAQTPDTGSDPYVYPGGGGVLRNRAGIRDAQLAAQFNDQRVAARMQELRAVEHVAQRVFSVASFREIHRHLFQDVYEWAGQFRTVDIRDGLGPGYFSVADRTRSLEGRGREVIDQPLRASRNLRGLTRDEFISALTRVTVQLDQWHPFRDGNMRATQVFVEQLAHDAGYGAQFRLEEGEWRKASLIALDEGDRGFRRIITRATIVPRAVAFKRDSQGSALRAFPELKGAYEVLTRFERMLGESRLQEPDRVNAVERKRLELLEVLNEGRVVDFGRDRVQERSLSGRDVSR
jgi:cell filamentation protein